MSGGAGRPLDVLDRVEVRIAHRDGSTVTWAPGQVITRKDWTDGGPAEITAVLDRDGSRWTGPEQDFRRVTTT